MRTRIWRTKSRWMTTEWMEENEWVWAGVRNGSEELLFEDEAVALLSGNLFLVEKSPELC